MKVFPELSWMYMLLWAAGFGRVCAGMSSGLHCQAGKSPGYCIDTLAGVLNWTLGMIILALCSGRTLAVLSGHLESSWDCGS